MSVSKVYVYDIAYWTYSLDRSNSSLQGSYIAPRAKSVSVKHGQL